MYIASNRPVREYLVIDFLDQQHFLCALVGQLAGRLRQTADSRVHRLDQQAVVVNSADDAAAVIEDKFAHHRAIADVLQSGQLFQNKGQIFFA